MKTNSKTKALVTETKSFTPSTRWANIFIRSKNGKKYYLTRGIGIDNLEESGDSYKDKLLLLLLKEFTNMEQKGIARQEILNLHVELFSQNVSVEPDTDDLELEV